MKKASVIYEISTGEDRVRMRRFLRSRGFEIDQIGNIYDNGIRLGEPLIPSSNSENIGIKVVSHSRLEKELDEYVRKLRS